MPLFNYSREVGTINTLTRISTATGIDNLSRTSVIRNIAESIAADTEFVTSNQNDAIAQFYSDTATGRFLDAKAFDFGISRNVLDKLVIFSQDQAVRIETLTEDKSFGDFLDTSDLTIPAGSELADLSSRYKVYLLDEVTLNPASNFAYVGVRIEPSTAATTNAGGTISLNESQVILLNKASIGQKTNKLQLRAVKPITIETKAETDAELRTRVIAAKTNLSKGTAEALALLLEQVPGLLGFHIKQNTRNANSLDVSLVTTSYVTGNNFSFIPAYVKNLSKSFFASGTDVEVTFPTKLEIYIEYTTGLNEIIPTDTINEVVKATINENFVYSQDNTIVKADLEKLVKAALIDLSNFEVHRMSGLDTDLEEIVVDSNDDLVIPDSYYGYITIASDNITKIANE